MPSDTNPRPSNRACSEPRRRGGRRPGAGAPAGNLNALKTGARSRQLRAFVTAMLGAPETRHMLERLIRMDQRRRDQLADALAYYAQLVRRSPPGNPRRRSIKEIRGRQVPEARFISEMERTIRQSARILSEGGRG